MSNDNDMLKCFFEEIGLSPDPEGKIWETECGNEVIANCLPTYCPHCQRTVEVAPGCRRCGSIEHTTSWHDADLEGKDGGAIEIECLNGDALKQLILGNNQEKK